MHIPASEIAAELERELASESNEGSNVPVIKHQEREYMGMLEYKKEEEPLVIRHLILGR